MFETTLTGGLWRNTWGKEYRNSKREVEVLPLGYAGELRHYCGNRGARCAAVGQVGGYGIFCRRGASSKCMSFRKPKHALT